MLPSLNHAKLKNWRKFIFFFFLLFVFCFPFFPGFRPQKKCKKTQKKVDRKTVLPYLKTMQNDFANMSAENENANLATVSFVETETERDLTFEHGFYHKKIVLNYDNTIVYVVFDTCEGESFVESAIYDKSGLSNEDIEWIDSEIECFSQDWADDYNKGIKEENEEYYALVRKGIE
jgi:hypothetical protein